MVSRRCLAKSQLAQFVHSLLAVKAFVAATSIVAMQSCTTQSFTACVVLDLESVWCAATDLAIAADNMMWCA